MPEYRVVLAGDTVVDRFTANEDRAAMLKVITYHRHLIERDDVALVRIVGEWKDRKDEAGRPEDRPAPGESEET